MRPSAHWITARRALRLVATTIPAWSMALQITGCTVIGYGVGSIVDRARTGRVRAQVFRIEPGTKLRVHLVRGGHFDGTLVRTGTRSRDDYAARYERWRAERRRGPKPPALGEEIRIDLRGGTTTSGHFAAMGIENVVLADASGHERPIPLRTIIDSDSTSASIPGSRFRRSFQTAPRLEMLVIETKTGEQMIGAEEIYSITLSKRPVGRWVGTLAGLGTDVGIVVAIAASSSSGCSYSP